MSVEKTSSDYFEKRSRNCPTCGKPCIEGKDEEGNKLMLDLSTPTYISLPNTAGTKAVPVAKTMNTFIRHKLVCGAKALA